MNHDTENAVIKYTILIAILGVVGALLFGFSHGGAW